ncbi:hypothetical protein MD484_g5612, partial [Candolleomyces efflorescens]
MSLPFAHRRAIQSSSVTAPAPKNAEATTSTSSAAAATTTSSVKGSKKPTAEAMSRLPFASHPLGVGRNTNNPGPSQRRSTNPEGSQPQGYYGHLLRPVPGSGPPQLGPSQHHHHAIQPVNVAPVSSSLQPLLDSVEVGRRAVHAHLDQAAAATVNATNALREQVAADVRDTVEALGKRLEDRMDRRDKAEDERNSMNLRVLGQVLERLKDLDQRVGRSGPEDTRSVMMRLSAIEFSAGDAWEGRKDPLADQDDEEPSDVENAQAPIAPTSLNASSSSRSSKETSKQPSAAPSAKEREESAAHDAEITKQLPEAPVPSTASLLLLPPPAPLPAGSSSAAAASAGRINVVSPTDKEPPSHAVYRKRQALIQSGLVAREFGSWCFCISTYVYISSFFLYLLVYITQSAVHPDASTAIFKPDVSPQAIKASSSYSPRPPMDGSVASLRLETLGEASFIGGDGTHEAGTTLEKEKLAAPVIPLVARPEVSPLPSPDTSRSASPVIRRSGGVLEVSGPPGSTKGQEMVVEEPEEAEAGMDDSLLDALDSLPAIEVLVEEEDEEDGDEDVEMKEEEVEEGGVLGAGMDSSDHSLEVAMEEVEVEASEEQPDSVEDEREDGTHSDLQKDGTDIVEGESSANVDDDVPTQPDDEPTRTSQSPLRQTSAEVGQAPLSTTASGEDATEPSSVNHLDEAQPEERLDGGDDGDHGEGDDEDQSKELDVEQDDLDVPDHDTEPALEVSTEEPVHQDESEDKEQRQPSLEPDEPLFLDGGHSDSEEQDSTGQVNGFDPLPDSDLFDNIPSDDRDEFAEAIWMSMQLPSSSPSRATERQDSPEIAIQESPLRNGKQVASAVVSPSKSATPRRSTSIFPLSSPSKGSGLSSRRPTPRPSRSAVREAEEREDLENDESPIQSFSTFQPSFKTSPIQQSTPARGKAKLGGASTVQPSSSFSQVDIDIDSLPPPPSSSPFCYPEFSGAPDNEAPEVVQEEEGAARSPSPEHVSLGSGAHVPPDEDAMHQDTDTSVEDLTIIPVMEVEEEAGDDGGLEYVDEVEPQLAAPTPRVPIFQDEDDDDIPPLPKPRRKYRSPTSDSEVDSEPEAEEKVEKKSAAAALCTPARPPSSQSASASARGPQSLRKSPSKADMYLRPPSLAASASRGDRSPNHPVSRTLIGTPLKSINLSTKLKKATPRKSLPQAESASTQPVIEISSGSSPEQSPRVLLQQKITKQMKKKEIKKEKAQQQQQQKANASSSSGGKDNADTSADADVIDLTMSNAEDGGQRSDSDHAYDFDSDDSTIIRGAPRKVFGTSRVAPAAPKPPASQAKAPAAPVQQKRLADRLLKPGQSAAATRIKRKQRPAVDGDSDNRPLKRARSALGAGVPAAKSKVLGSSRAGRHASSASSNTSKGKGRASLDIGGDSSDGDMIVVKREKNLKGASAGGPSSSSSKTPSNRSSSSSILIDEDGSRKLRHRTVDPKNHEIKWPTLNKHGSRKFQREVSTR